MSAELYFRMRKFDRYCPPHINPETEVVLVYGGTLELACDSSRTELRAGELFWIPPYHLHSFLPGDGMDATVFMFSQRIFRDHRDSLPQRVGLGGACRLDAPVGAYLDYLLPQLAEEEPAPLDVLSLYAAFAALLGRQGTPRPETDVRSRDLSRAIDYIFDHLQEDISVVDIAQEFGWDARRFSYEFRQTYGIKLTDLISNIRIEHASVLLETAEISITEIASRCGFGSLRSFNRIFLDRVGCTPSAYRLQHTRK